MATTPWKTIVRKYDGTTRYDVDPMNTPVTDLEARTDYLKQTLDMLTDKSSVTLVQAPCDTDVVAGTAVFFDKTSGRFGKAKAAWSGEYGPNGELVAADEAILIGIALTAGALGFTDIVKEGSASLNDVQMNNLFGTTDPAKGMWYLSGFTKGLLSSTKEACPIPALFHRGSGECLLMVGAPPEHSHIHKYHELAESWYDVSDPRFDGMEKPVGAIWGYDKANDDDVNELFMTYPGDFTVTVAGVVDVNYQTTTDNVWYTQAAQPQPYNHIVIYTSVPYNYGQPIVRAMRTDTLDELSIQGDNGVVTVNMRDRIMADAGLSGIALSAVSGRTFERTKNVSTVRTQGDGIRSVTNETTGEVVLTASLTNHAKLRAELINFNNAMQVTDGPFVYLAFPTDRTSEMTGVIPCPSLTPLSGFHYELKVFADARGMLGGTPSSPVTFPSLSVTVDYLMDPDAGSPVDMTSAPTLSTTLPATPTDQTMVYRLESPDVMSVNHEGIAYVTLSATSSSGNKNLTGFGIMIEIVSD